MAASNTNAVIGVLPVVAGGAGLTTQTQTPGPLATIANLRAVNANMADAGFIVIPINGVEYKIPVFV